ncbi:hypothetical protein [Subtercola boreus]|uniref:hypothetical protein n=1 Tax=Subtercola boreus TaxID=120213 RepID=UPI001B85D7EE
MAKKNRATESCFTVPKIIIISIGDDEVIFLQFFETYRCARECYGHEACVAQNRARDTPMVIKLDRLARPLPDARDIDEDLTRRRVKINLGGSI